MSSNLSGVEMRAALDTLHAIGQDCVGQRDFARDAACNVLLGLQLRAHSRCRSATSTADTAESSAISRARFRARVECSTAILRHPLVREHGRNPAGRDAGASKTCFGQRVLNALLYLTTLPARSDRSLCGSADPCRTAILVSFVVNRSKRGFTIGIASVLRSSDAPWPFVSLSARTARTTTRSQN